MSISDEEKRQIMSNLARGNSEAFDKKPIKLPQNEQIFDANKYQNFDDFAQRSYRNKLQQSLDQYFN